MFNSYKALVFLVSRGLEWKSQLKQKSQMTDDSKNKLGKIESEFQNYQVYLQSRCTAIVNLYSATKQQAQLALKKIKQPNSKK